MVGVLVDRQGHVLAVMLGDSRRIYLPDIGRDRVGSGRFRGIRLIRTHLGGEALGRDDLTDLTKLRLDLVVSLTVGEDGFLDRVHWAHLLPANPDGDPWATYDAPSVTSMELDFEGFIRDLEDEFRRSVKRSRSVGSERVILVVPDLAARPAGPTLAEMHELCLTANVEVVDQFSIRNPDSRTVVRHGKLEEITLRSLQLDAETLVFGCNLAPNQLRALALATDLKVIDRTQLILDIFARRATSADGKLQVELAQLKYSLPRLAGQNPALSRLAGGIGSRGPGESKLELDRRRARDRIHALEKRIKKLSQQRAQKRGRRDARGVPVVAIVGYTNAGKSTLLNTLTKSKVLSEDKLFATLDPTTRRLRFPQDRELVLTDTVGFIRDLPPDLVTAFRATLEELDQADLMLHLVDASEPDILLRLEAVEDLLKDLGLHEKPSLLVLNKVDRLSDEAAEALATLHGGIPVSAVQRPSLAPLVAEIQRRLFDQRARPPASPEDGPGTTSAKPRPWSP